MSRSRGWIHPRRRHKRPLGLCELTYHAFDSYRNRVDAAATWEDVLTVARASYLIGRKPDGALVYRGEGCRLIVHKAARREPVVLTVIAGEGGAA